MFNKLLKKQSQLIRATDPERIYVENVRSFFHLPYKAAKVLCELAVKEGLFRKKYGVVCPSCGRIIKSYNIKEEIDEEIECELCRDLEEPKHIFQKSEVEIIEYYQLKNGTRK